MRIHRRLWPVSHVSPRNLRHLLRCGRNRLQPGILRRGWRDFLRTREEGRPKIRRRNSHEHKIRIPARPAQRLLFCFKKSIDDQGASFKSGAAGASRCFAAHHRRTGIDREQSAIGQNDSAPVRNPARIDGAMAGLQTRSGRTDVTPRPAIRTAATARPVDRDAREEGLLASKDRGRK